MLADSTVTVSGTSPFFLPPTSASASSAAAAAAATRALIMNPAAYLAAGAAAAPFLYGGNALRYYYFIIELNLVIAKMLIRRNSTPRSMRKFTTSSQSCDLNTVDSPHFCTPN